MQEDRKTRSAWVRPRPVEWAYMALGLVLLVRYRLLIHDAFVSCELNHSAPSHRLAGLLSRARAVRSYGCASRALALVACGALDAHVDVRGRLTAESFLAGAFLVEQAGGCVLDLDGRDFEHMTDLRSTARVVAAATPDLAHQIVDEFDE